MGNSIIFQRNTERDMDGVPTLSMSTSCFTKIEDIEIICVIASWLSNGIAYEDYVFFKLILRTMKSEPYQFVLNYKREYLSKNASSFFNFLTYRHLNNLIVKLKEIEYEEGGLYRRVVKESHNSKNKYAHDCLANIFDCDTGFQSNNSFGTFYRFNLLLYWLTHVIGAWDKSKIAVQCLLPCNDNILHKAKKEGLFRRTPRTTLESTIELTNIAIKKYGDDFYKLYDILSQ